MPKDVVSVETVLNSRCSSDFDGDPKRNHWGIYMDNQPSKRIVDQIIGCCKVPQFSNGKLVFWFEGKYLFLAFEKTENPLEERVLHIESGMQHEAIYLACASFGIGTCIHNMGINGTQYDGKIVTARHLILEMADCYKRKKYTTAAPGPETPFKLGGNLPEPKRNGEVECLPELERLTISRSNGASAKEEDISQLLWAAKGRAPHYIKGYPWGLTIPTWGGQEYTDVYLVKDHQLHRYVNWTRRSHPLNRLTNRMLRYVFWRLYGKTPYYLTGNPTHDIEFLRKVNISSQLDGVDTAIILSQNERTNRALWEVGYMLENMFLQARSLGTSFETRIFEPEETSQLAKEGIQGAVAAVLV